MRRRDGPPQPQPPHGLSVELRITIDSALHRTADALRESLLETPFSPSISQRTAMMMEGFCWQEVTTRL